MCDIEPKTKHEGSIDIKTLTYIDKMYGDKLSHGLENPAEAPEIRENTEK